MDRGCLRSSGFINKSTLGGVSLISTQVWKRKLHVTGLHLVLNSDQLSLANNIDFDLSRAICDREVISTSLSPLLPHHSFTAHFNTHS